MKGKRGKLCMVSTMLLLTGGVCDSFAAGEDLSAWGSYGPCAPGAVSRTKASHVLEVGKSLTNVPTDGIDVLECRRYTGMGPTNIVDCGGRPYTYCLLNDNDGGGNYVMLGVREKISIPHVLLWNKLGSASEVANSEVGPGFQLASYKIADWQQAQIIPGKFGNGLFINHDIGEGWTNDGGNFFAANINQAGLTPAKGTIEFWFTFKYDSSTHNHAYFFNTANSLANHFPDGNYSNFGLTAGWNGWDYGSYGKRFFACVGSVCTMTADYSAAPIGPLAFSDGTVFHFALTWDANGIDGTADTIRLYINGNKEASSVSSWSAAAQFDPYLYLGTSPNRDPWDHNYNAVKGVTDNFIIWDYAKTDFPDRFQEVPVVDSDHDGINDLSDNCPAVANPGQENNDGDTEGDVCDADDDNDTVLDSSDNCPLAVNADQLNNDGDAQGDVCDDDDDNDSVADTADNCPFTANADQQDTDGDGQGDVCDGDSDGDGIANNTDNCPAVANADQADNDGDTAGDVCDSDDDNDGVADNQPDNCPLAANPDQNDQDGDNIGDTCDIDIDGDGVNNDSDNCKLTVNAAQEDTDSDGSGDACDADDDNDTVLDAADNCPLIVNADQADADHDGQGDMCDGDLDGDGIANNTDNCPNTANASQNDYDSDGKGDACDDDVDGDGVANSSDACALTELNAVVKPAEGCSIDQLCPCEGPRSTTGSRKNHGSYVSCVAKTAESFFAAGLITQAEKDAVCSEAGQSSCGGKK